MTCIYTIPVSLIAPAIERFLSEFPPVLFAAVQRHRSDLGVLKAFYFFAFTDLFYLIFLLL